MVTTRSATRGPVIFEPLSHPILESVDPADAVRFKRARERYELEIQQKEQDGQPMVPASYQVSIEPRVLKSMHDIGYFDEIAPEVEFSELTDDHIKKCIDQIASTQTETEPDSNVIQAALATIKTNMKIRNARARVFQLAIDFDNKMEEIGYGTFRESNPKMAAKLLASRLHPKALQSQIISDFDYVPKLKSNWKFFLKYVATQAEHIEKGQASLARAEGTKKSEGGGTKQRKAETEKGRGKHSDKDKPKKGVEKPLPDCLNKECDGKHYLRDCTKTSKERKKELYKEYRDKKAANEDKARYVKHPDTSESSMIDAVFAEVETRAVCADTGSCINLMPPDLFASLTSKGACMKVNKFDINRKFGMAVKKDGNSNDVYVECDRKVTLHIQLKVRHASWLTIRNVTWYVAVQDASDPLLSNGLLKALGLDAREALAAACERYNGVADASTLMPDDHYATGSIGRILAEQGVYHSDGGSEDEEDKEDPIYLELGEDTEEQVQDACKELLQKARNNGMTSKGLDHLTVLLKEYRDIFRIRLGNDPPAKVEPMQVKLDPSVPAIIAKSRRYSPGQRGYLTAFLKRAQEYGFIKESRTATWAAAPLLVEKPKTGRYRLTFDYRPVNAATIPVVWPMPHIDSECADFAGSKYFATIDFCSGYWQLPLAEDSQDALSFITHEGIWKPTRSAQGAKNSSANFQSRVEPCFSTLRDNLKAWQDDFVIHHKTEAQLLTTLQVFFETCRDKNLKVSALKSDLFTTSVHWCGRVIDQDGVTFDPRNLSGIQQVVMPETAGELSQFIYCLQWMSYSIPDFANRIKPLREVLEAAYKRSGKRTRKSINKIALSSLSWGRTHVESYTSLQDSLREAVKLAHPDPSLETCIYTDASETHWAAVVTQCDKEQLEKPTEDQRHKPLAFLSSAFKDSELHWSTFEKEGYAIYQVFSKLDYLMFGEKPSHLYTDHRNLLFVYNPLSVQPEIGRHVVNKVQRWALYLSRFHYNIEHVAGEKNVMADIMTRWFSGYRGKSARARISQIRALLTDEDIVSSPFSEGFIWPTSEMIFESQKKHSKNRPVGLVEKEDGTLKIKDKIWIPKEDIDLQTKLLVISHCGTGGHRASASTHSTLLEQYYWDSMKNDTDVFVHKCIHCLLSRGGNRVPRPLGWQILATKANEVLHFDFLFMGKGVDDKVYLLLLRDGLSNYIWLWPTTKAESSEVSKAISRWIDVFTRMDIWVSDQGSHFKNTVVKLLAEQHHINHHFTTAYSPWSNGSIERCCREVLRAATAILSELRLAPQDWPSVVNIIQKVLNESPLERLGKRDDGTFRTPLEVMTGLKPCRTNLAPSVEYSNKTGVSLDHARCEQILRIDDLKEALDSMHKEVAELVRRNRSKQIKAHNRKTKIITPNFSVGDFVLVRRAQDKGHKLSFKWQGPMRVTKIVSPLVYEVTSITANSSNNVHAVRLKLYRSDMDGKEVSQELLSHATHTESHYENVHALHELKKDKKNMFIRVEWEGLPDLIDHTWEPIERLHEDVPKMLHDYLQGSKTRLSKKAMTVIRALLT